MAAKIKVSKINNKQKREITFIVKESEEGGYFAEAVGYSIFTQGKSRQEIKNNIIEAVECYFGGRYKIPIVRANFIEEELLKI